MKMILFVILQVIVASGILYGYYHLMLRNKKFHQYNRFYLLASVIISVLIPFLNIPVYFEQTEIQSSMVLQTLQTISSASPEGETLADFDTTSTAVSTPFNWNVVLYIVYWLAASLLFIRILISLRKIKAIIKNNPVEDLNGIRFINTVEPGTPFSFFRWLFWNKKIELRSQKGEQIFRHEVFHIQQKHSLDIVFMELLTVVFWINPFFHLVKKEIKAIHEFLADQFAAHKTEKWEYAELLLMQALNTQQQLVNPFFHNQIKRRIAMITNPQKTSHRYLRKLLVLPVAAIVVALFAFTYKKKQDTDNIIASGKPITIVIDAAHGGTDAGAISPDSKYSEAQISLEIARQIQGLAKEYNVEAIMTREDDKFPGNVANKEDGLKERIEITNKIKPDAFIAIHINAAYNGSRVNQTKYSGFEAYVSDKREDAKGKLLASAILKNLSPVYKTSVQLRQRKNTGVYVLDHNSYPAVLLQCGYINNLEDLAFITDKGNQEKIARSILEAITKYTSVNDNDQSFLPADTVPKPFLARGFVYSKPDSLILAADSVRWVQSPSKTKINFKKALVILNGQKVNAEILSQKTIISKQITFYPVNDPDAIKLFGTEASKGVIVFEEAQVINIPPFEYYKDELAESKKTRTDDMVFEKVEIEPTFSGGQGAWRKFLERNLNASVAADNKAPAGEYTVFIQFIVHKDGRISDVKPLTNHGYGMEQEALRIIKKGQPWLPAIQNGRKVNAYLKQRVNFVVGRTTGAINTYKNTNDPDLSKSKSTEADDNVFEKVEIEPSLPGSKNAWKYFVESNIDRSVAQENHAPAGKYTVFVQFIVHSDGSISNIKVLTNHGFGMEEEAMRMVKKSPKWVPGIQNGRTVDAYVKEKVEFVAYKDLPPSDQQWLYAGRRPTITLSELEKMPVYRLLNVDKETEILGFRFGMDKIKDGVLVKNGETESKNTGDRFNAQTIELIRNAVPGNTIIIDYIRIKKDDREIKIPSVLYGIVE